MSACLEGGLRAGWSVLAEAVRRGILAFILTILQVTFMKGHIIQGQLKA